MRAGVFDSGVGGLSVVKSLLEHRIFEDIVYYGDTARVPYGAKDKNTIVGFSLEALEFFKNFDIDILIIACNSVSAYAIEELKAKASIPVVGVIEPGIRALKNKVQDKQKNILIIGTKATIASKKYEIGLREGGYKNLTSLETGLFVPMIEEGIFDENILQACFSYYFKELKNIEVIILACTHFPLIKNKICKYFNGCLSIHSGEAIVEYLLENFKIEKSKKETTLKLFASDNPKKLEQTAAKWLGDFYPKKRK